MRELSLKELGLGFGSDLYIVRICLVNHQKRYRWFLGYPDRAEICQVYREMF